MRKAIPYTTYKGDYDIEQEVFRLQMSSGVFLVIKWGFFLGMEISMNTNVQHNVVA